METVPSACAHDHGPGGSSSKSADGILETIPTGPFQDADGILNGDARLAHLERELANVRTAVCDTRALVNELIARSAGVAE